MLIELLDPTPIIQTRKGRNIALERGVAITKQAADASAGATSAKFNDRTKIQLGPRKPACGQYNCHGLTFLSRRAHLHPNGIPLVLEDDEYVDVPETDARPGDIAVYRGGQTQLGVNEIEHTGVVTWVQHTTATVVAWTKPIIWVVSKWGQDAEYIHRSDYCPYAACKITYMREGRNDKPADIGRN